MNNDSTTMSISTRALIMKAETTNTSRCSAEQLRRAAGSQAFENFLNAVHGWTKFEIDTMDCPKNPVHMAAWKGNIQNLKYLIDELGCNVNVISTGEYSYGKTPIFFALTQSREDVVEYLLNRNAYVKIVNNKGQTPLSIASSHLSKSAINKIMEKETEQNNIQWKNYRITHSDGLDYGDLDPRFLERPIRNTDNVTDLAINPTTKEIRRGNFLRNNPHQAKEIERRKEKQQQKNNNKRKKERKESIILSPEQEKQLERAWKNLKEGFSGINGLSPNVNDLIIVIQINMLQQKVWIPNTAQRLEQIAENNQKAIDFLKSVSISCPKEITMVDRLISYITNPKIERTERNRSTSPILQPIKSNILLDPKWKFACEIVKDLSIVSLDNGGSFLSLPSPPKWVDDLNSLHDLINEVSKESLVSIDAEWQSKDKISTLQIGIREHAWVIDLLVETTNFEYRKQCKNFIHQLFYEKTLLGFAIGHDIPKLEQFTKEKLPRNTCLDIQSLWAGPQMPGLAICASKFITLPLSKKEQCSDWSHRPLSQSQLDYAGLDAVILAYILAEKYRSFVNNSRIS